ncbi:hydrogenase subunit MbhD domain-containing protein [Candidatus Bipolaricaulota bacterium]
MIARWILLALLPVVAGVALTQSRRLSAIIGMGLFSFMLAAAYLLMHAPDVAITEATIGAALVTAIYVLAIRRTGRLIVVADEVPGLIAREGDHVTGLEYEILEGFAREIGLDLSISFVPLRRVHWLVAHREADMGAGGIIPLADDTGSLIATPSHLETGVFAFAEGPAPQGAAETAPDYEGYYSELLPHGRNGTLSLAASSLDLARVIDLGRAGASLQGLDRIDGEYGYSFLIARQRKDLQQNYADYLSHLRSSGQLASMIERHFS